MDALALERAQQRIADAAAGRREPAALEATLERAREQLESLAESSGRARGVVPDRSSAAVRDGLRAEVLPVARHLAEIRGLLNQTIRRLERIEADLLAERHARVDDLALLVDLVSSGWRGVERRLDRLERTSTGSSARSRTLARARRGSSASSRTPPPPDAATTPAQRQHEPEALPAPGSDSSSIRPRARARAPARSAGRAPCPCTSSEMNGWKIRAASPAGSPGRCR